MSGKHPGNLQNIMAEIAEVAGYLWERGWAERNSGNISVDVTGFMLVEKKRPHLRIALPISQPELAGRSFFVKVAGARMRDVLHHPDQNLLLITIHDDLKGYDIVMGGEDKTSRPTSEFISHLKVHQYIRQNNMDQKVFLHTHPTHLIALSHYRDYCSNENKLSRLLLTMHPEVKILLPEGVGFVPYRCPGSEELADVTIDIIKKHRVILWEKHGGGAIARSPAEAFDMIDMVNKAAQIFLICRSAGYEPDGLTSMQLAEIERAFSSK